MRLVSLTCSNTEIVGALGRGDLLVGCDDYSDWPEAVVAGLPRVGKDLDIDVEKVAALAPDLVLASLTVPGHEKVVAALEEAGLPVLVLAPTSLEDIYEDIRTVADRLGVADHGEAIVHRMREAIGRGSDVPEAERPRILVEWWPKPVIVPGRRSWVTDLIDAAGGLNPWADRDQESTPVTDEEVRAARPDAVVVAWCGVPFEKYRTEIVTRRPGWQEVPALVNGQVHCIPEAWLGRPGPRLVSGFAALADLVAALREA